MGDFYFTAKGNQQVVELDENFEDEDLAPLTTYGYVKISNYLQGSLYIDGKYIKTANKNKLIKEQLTTGRHTIKIKTDNETWEQVTITEDQTTSLTAKFTYTPPPTNKRPAPKHGTNNSRQFYYGKPKQ